MRHAALFAAALALSGCFQMASLLTVRADGSGTVTETITLSEQALAFAAMSDSTGEAMLADPAALARRAAALGEGVVLVSVAETDSGYTAVFGFESVESLRLTPLSTPIGEEGDEAPDDTAPFTFAFAPAAGGAPAVLTVTVPDDDERGTADADTSEAALAEQRQALAMARALVGDAQVAVRLAVEGRVVETDALFRDGDAVTLLDLRLGALLDLVEANPELMGAADVPLAEVARLAAGRDDLRFQPPGPVTVRFE